MPAKTKKDSSQDLNDVLFGIRKEYGQESIRLLGESPLADIEGIPTGSILLDEALGVGGFPRGRIIEIYGPESSGKTSIALHAIANAQKADGIAAFIDAEHALDPDWAETLGVDVEALLVSQPDTGEQALDIAEKLCKSAKVAIIVIDSVAALVPRAEIEGDMGDSHMGLQARLMSQALRKLTGIANTTKTTIIFINQLREKIGVVFGNPETTAGGKALKFYASVRVDVRKIETHKDGAVSIGHRLRIKVVKNKVGPPFKVAEVDFYYDCGLSPAGELIDVGTERGALTRAGSWYVFEGVNIGNGKDQARLALLEDVELLARVKAAVLAAPKPGKAKASAKGTAAKAALELGGAAPWEAGSDL
jgi:recombination protein RecA